MKMKQLLPVLLALSLVACAHSKTQPSSSAPATPAAKSAKPAEKAELPGAISCAKGKDARTLTVVTKGEGCSLEYTKAGKTSSAASSAHGTKHCNDSQKKIREHLEKAGFKCS